jgi:hypothetical protein
LMQLMTLLRRTCSLGEAALDKLRPQLISLAEDANPIITRGRFFAIMEIMFSGMGVKGNDVDTMERSAQSSRLIWRATIPATVWIRSTMRAGRFGSFAGIELLLSNRMLIVRMSGGYVCRMSRVFNTKGDMRLTFHEMLDGLAILLGGTAEQKFELYFLMVRTVLYHICRRQK